MVISENTTVKIQRKLITIASDFALFWHNLYRRRRLVFDMQCKYCGEKDQNRLLISMSATNGRITSDTVTCFRCYWMEKLEREKKEDGLSRQTNAREIKGKLKEDKGISQRYV